MNRRQRIGYILTLVSLAILLGGFLLSPFAAAENTRPISIWVGVIITVLPLAVLTPRAIKRDLRAYQSLALLAPIYFFCGGIIWLWRSPWLGMIYTAAALMLEVGTILHSYKKRDKSKKKQ